MRGDDVKFTRALVFINCGIPALMIAIYAITGRMGANPVDFFTRTTGTLTLVFLLLGLAVTPLRKLSGWGWLGKLRRMIGLYAFFYAFLHFVAYIWFDQFFAFGAILQDVIARPFITVGFAAFVFMVPLAVTSTNGWIKRLGGKRWNRIHRRVYGVAILGVTHFYLLVKADTSRPILYGSVLAVLLGARIVFWVRERRKPGKAGAAAGRSAKPAVAPES